MASATARMIDLLGYDPSEPCEPREPDVGSFDVPVGAIVRARQAGRVVAVARLESGRTVVLEDRCPHDGGRISDGWVEGEHIVCARHGWELDADGRRCPGRPECKLRE